MKYFIHNHHDFWQWPGGESSAIDADVVFMWADWPFRNPVHTYMMLGKKVITYEHGFGALWDYELNHRGPISDGYLALGEESKKSLIRAGVPEAKILVTGNPIYDDIKPVVREGKEKKKALFVALHWVSDRLEYNIRTFNKLKEAYDFDWTIKLNDKTAGFGNCKRWQSYTEGKILEDVKKNLPKYDYVFTPRASTFESFARLYDIPVYVVDEQETYRDHGDPGRVEMDYTFLNIGDKLPKIKPIDNDKYILRPSLSIKDILKWVKQL